MYLHLAFPNVNLSHYHGTFVETIGTLLLTKLQTFFRSHQLFSLMSFIRGSNPGFTEF